MGPKEREIKRRLRVLEHAEKIGNVRMKLLPGEHPMKYSENDYNERHAECPEGMSISHRASWSLS